jgi:molybdopterin converting factor small subunit
MKKVELRFYAQLRDYFGEVTTLEAADSATLSDLKNTLIENNALAAEWLRVSRWADETAFVEDEVAPQTGAIYYLLPPSSGG